MTVPTSTAKSGPYAGAGTVGPFTVGFRFLENSHLQVIQTSSTGVDTTLALTTNYTVAGAGAASGSVTLVVALPVGQKLTIIRSVSFTQEADYVQNDAFPAESHERSLDKLTMQTQQLLEAVNRAAKLPVTSTADSAELVADITLLADNITGLTAVYGSIASVNTVAGAIASVNTVAGSIANVNATGASIASVNTVAGAIANVNTVAANNANVTTVGTNIASVNSAATNMAAIIAAPGQATAAASSATASAASATASSNSAAAAATSATNSGNSATAAASSATAASGSATSASGSASTATTKAGEASTSAAAAAASAASIDPTTLVRKTGDTGAAITPVGSTAQRPTPVTGHFRFNTTNVQFEGYTGSAWSGVGGASGGGGNPIVYENDKVVSVNYTITSGKNASSTGPLTINSGVVVTIPTGSRWVVL